MEATVTLEATFIPSEDIVFREIEGEFIIVPLTSGVGGTEEDALFTLNETGRAIWERLDGKRSLKDLVKDLSTEYEAPAGEIEGDVTGLVTELLKRSIVVEVKPAPAK